MKAMRGGVAGAVVLVCLLASAGRGWSAPDEDPEPEDAKPWFPTTSPESEPAKEPPARPPSWATEGSETRFGFFLSGGLGGGVLSGVDGQTESASAMEVRAGLMLGPRVGLAVDILATAHTRRLFGEAVYMFSSIGPSVTYWFSRRLWAVAGLSAVGLFRRPTDEMPASESGGAGVHALVGFECYRTRSGNGAVNLQVRMFGGVPSDDDGVGGVLIFLGGSGFGMDPSE